MNRQSRATGDRYPSPIGAAGFLLAEQALENQDEERDDPQDAGDDIWLDRPPLDWEQTAVLLLARVQLDEMVTLIRDATGVEDPVAEPERALSVMRDRLKPLIDAVRLGWESGDMSVGATDPAFELAGIEEGLELRSALSGSLRVAHGFAVDGSITMTAGPALPECAVLGLKGDGHGLLEDEPEAVFEAARRATECAAYLVFRIPRDT